MVGHLVYEYAEALIAEGIYIARLKARTPLRDPIC